MRKIKTKKANAAEPESELEELETYVSDIKDPMLFLPAELGEHILFFTEVSAIPSILCVSNLWCERSGNPTLWQHKLTEAEARRLNTALYQAIRAGNAALVQRYCQLGAHPNTNIGVCVDLETDFGDTSCGEMSQPKVLHYAANHLKGEKGRQIVKTLLYFGADFNHSIEVQKTYGNEAGTWTKTYTCKPSDLTRNDSMKTLLLIADFEDQLRQKRPIDELLSVLQTIADHDISPLKDYLDNLLNINEGEKYQGLQKEIVSSDILLLSQDRKFQDFNHKIRSNRCVIQ